MVRVVSEPAGCTQSNVSCGTMTLRERRRRTRQGARVLPGRGGGRGRGRERDVRDDEERFQQTICGRAGSSSQSSTLRSRVGERERERARTVVLQKRSRTADLDDRLARAADTPAQRRRQPRLQRNDERRREGTHLSLRACSSKPLTSARTASSSSMLALTCGSCQTWFCERVAGRQRALSRSRWRRGERGRTGKGHTRSKTLPAPCSPSCGSSSAPRRKWWISSASRGAMGASTETYVS